MKMKSIFILSITILFLTASCNNWLDVKSSTELDADDLFTSENGFAEALVGIYSQLSDASLYGGELTWGLLDVLGGQYIDVKGNYNKFSTSSYKQNSSERNDNAIGIVDQLWRGLYTQIANLNALLESIDKHKEIFIGENYNIIKGEAIGLRAFLHLELLRMYGWDYENGKDKETLPFVEELTTKVAPMLTEDQVLTKIITELNSAKELLQQDPILLGTTPSEVLASLPSGNYTNYGIETWHNRRFHFNYFAVQAALARAYQWKGDRPNALQAAEEILKYQASRFPWVLKSNLTTINNSSYNTAENQDRTFATEHIFALNIRSLENNIQGFLNSIGGTNNILNSDVTKFNEGDLRRQFLYTYVGEKYLLNKFYQPETVSTFFKYRMPIIRISEMYLIAAESTDDVSKAATYLDELRNQRGIISHLVEEVEDGFLYLEDIPYEIMLEYQREFCGEGQVWFYYKRNRITAIPNTTELSGLDMFVFDIPEDEIIYGGRKNSSNR